MLNDKEDEENVSAMLRKERVDQYEKALAISTTVCYSNHQTSGSLFFQRINHIYFLPKGHNTKSYQVTEPNSKFRMSEFVLSVKSGYISL